MSLSRSETFKMSEDTQRKLEHLLKTFQINIQLKVEQVWDIINKYIHIEDSAKFKMVRTAKIVKLLQSQAFTEQKQDKEMIYLLLEGQAVIKKMFVNATGQEQQIQSTFKLLTAHGLHNYKNIHQSTRIFIEAKRQCKFLVFELQQKMSFKFESKNRLKKQFLSHFLGIEKLTKKNNFIFQYFKEHKYTKNCWLTKENEPINNIIIIKEGNCTYFKNMYYKERAELSLPKPYHLFKRNTNTIVGCEYFTPSSKSKKQFRCIQENREYFYQFEAIPWFDIYVDSAEIIVYELDIKDLKFIPPKNINHLKKACKNQMQNLVDSAHQRLQRHIQFLNKQAHKIEQEKYVTQSHLTLTQRRNSQYDVGSTQFNALVSQLMNNRIKQQRSESLGKKVSLTVTDFNKVQTSAVRLAEFKNLLSIKLDEKEKLIENYYSKAKDINQIDNRVEDDFKEKLIQIINKNKNREENQSEEKSNIAHYRTLLDVKQKIFEKKARNSVPLLVMTEKEVDKIDSKSFQQKLYRKGIKPDLKKPELDHTPVKQKIDKMKQVIIKKINISNRIKEQYMTIKSDFQPFELNVLKHYQTMKELQDKNKSDAWHVKQDNQYNILMELLKSKESQHQESLERVHQRTKFLRKSTLTPYSHEDHLRSKMRLHRYSVTSHNFFKKDNKHF